MKRIALIISLFLINAVHANRLSQALEVVKNYPAEAAVCATALYTQAKNWYLAYTGTTISSLPHNPGKKVHCAAYVPPSYIPTIVKKVHQQLEQEIIKPSANAQHLTIQEQATINNDGSTTVIVTVCQRYQQSVWDGWNLSETGTTIKGRFYTKHALERMAPATPEVIQELERRALKKGYQRGSEEFNNYIKPRGIPPTLVELIISSTPGTKVADRMASVHELDTIKVVVGVLGQVITVIEKQ